MNKVELLWLELMTFDIKEYMQRVPSYEFGPKTRKPKKKERNIINEKRRGEPHKHYSDTIFWELFYEWRREGNHRCSRRANHPRALGEGSPKGNRNCRIYHGEYNKVVTRETGTGITNSDRNESEDFNLECSGVK